MSLLYVDSCGDFYSTLELAERWDAVGGVPTVLAGGGRRGGGCIVLNADTASVTKNVAANTTYIVGMAIKMTTMVATDLFTLMEGITPHIICRLTALGAIEVFTAPSTSLGITSTGLITAGFFNFVELKVTVADGTGGAVDVQINKTNRLNLTMQDTRNGGSAGTIDNIVIEGSAGVLTIDDLYISNTVGAAPQNDFLGDVRIDASLPIGDGSTVNWPTVFPASPTTLFDKVNDPLLPDRLLSYVASNVSDELALFAFPAQPDVGEPSDIFGVQLSLFMNKDKEGARLVQPVIRPVATNIMGSSFNTLAEFKYFTEMYQENPETMADWTEALLEATEFGAGVV